MSKEEKRPPTPVKLPGAEYYFTASANGRIQYHGRDLLAAMDKMKLLDVGARVVRSGGLLLSIKKAGAYKEKKGKDDERSEDTDADADGAAADDGPTDRFGPGTAARGEEETEGAGRVPSGDSGADDDGV